MIDVLKVTKKILFKEFHRIARENGVKLNIKSMLGGWYCITENKISINRNARKQALPFMFFHELGHLHCCKNVDSYKPYHTKEGVKEFKKTVDSIYYNYWILTHKKH